MSLQNAEKLVIFVNIGSTIVTTFRVLAKTTRIFDQITPILSALYWLPALIKNKY